MPTAPAGPSDQGSSRFTSRSMPRSTSRFTSRSTSRHELPGRDDGDACPGALRLHTADDGALARVRVPGGVLAADQADALAAAAERLGDGVLHLTSRGNVQLRGLGAGCGGELAEALGSAGLLPSRHHERVRNIVVSPLTGLDGRGERDVRPWLRELDGLLCASDAARALSGRFLFALDDGRGDVAALGADVVLRAAAGGDALLGFAPGVPGGVSSRGPDGGSARDSARDSAHVPEVLRVAGAAAGRAALIAAETFLDAVREASAPNDQSGHTGRTAIWRVSELPGRGDGLLAETARRLAHTGIPSRRELAPVRGREPEAGPAEVPPGIIRNPERRPITVSVLAPLGRLSAAQWRSLATLAREHGAGELRLTPWRGVLVPGVAASRAARSLADLAAAGLVTAPDSPWRGVSACIGRPGCAKSRADVRADAATALGPAGGLPVHWSGCERRCGHPQGDHVDVVAAPGGPSAGYQVSTARAGTVRAGAPLIGAATGREDLAAAVTAARTRPRTPPP
ncbi:precorrin-3B synthase [Streptomyces jumonjinensis]|uniref:precorrin-3B synthase n=1 Tax=Streptomyces jumonjinensis TaxID=1945 RepID=UPI0037942740